MSISHCGYYQESNPGRGNPNVKCQHLKYVAHCKKGCVFYFLKNFDFFLAKLLRLESVAQKFAIAHTLFDNSWIRPLLLGIFMMGTNVEM